MEVWGELSLYQTKSGVAWQPASPDWSQGAQQELFSLPVVELLEIFRIKARVPAGSVCLCFILGPPAPRGVLWLDRKWNIPSALTHLEHIDALFIRPPKPDVSARGVSSLRCSHTDNDDLRGWTCVMSPLQVYRHDMYYYMN